jgi:hypothetical protein
VPYKDPKKRHDYHAAYGKQWNKDNPEARAAIQKKHDEKRYSTTGRIKQRADVRQRRHIRQRLWVLERYGGCCAFCGITQYEFLTIDHINGDGKAHRKEYSPQYRNMYDFLFRTEFRPDLYRILCANCHMALTRFDVRPDGEPLHDLDYWREFSKLRTPPESEAG